MIKCKEDLINTYIENDYGELRDVLFSKCANFEMKWLSGNSACNPDSDQLDYALIHIDENLELMDIAADQIEGLKKLTLSDLKPRTEYEKVTESIFDLRDEFERGELYRLRRDDIDGYVKITDLETLVKEIQGMGVYRLVEKEIDERQEFIERAKDLIDVSKDVDYSLGNMYDAGCRFQD